MYFIPNLSKFRCATPSISPTVTIFVPKTIDFAPKRPPESSVQPTFMIMVSSATRIMEAGCQDKEERHPHLPSASKRRGT